MRFSTSPPPFPALSSALPEPVDDQDESGVHPVGSLRPGSDTGPSTARPTGDEVPAAHDLPPTIPPPDEDDDLDPGQRRTPVDEVRASERYREANTEPAPTTEEALKIVSDLDGPVTRPAPADEPARASGAKRLPSIPGLRRVTSKPASSGKRPRQPLDKLLECMKASFDDADYEGAHRWASEVLALDPDNPGARNYLESCSRVLEQRVIGRVGDLSRTPTVLMTEEQIRWLSLDHRAGFLLSMIDGFTTLEELIDIAGMPRDDVLRVLGELIDQGVIGVR